MKPRPLVLALLIALIGHGLWLAHAQLRQRRQPPPQALRSRDDSPELLVFSRLPPESLAPAPIPLPPDNLPPPPPPLLPTQAPAAARPAAVAKRATAAKKPPRATGKASLRSSAPRQAMGSTRPLPSQATAIQTKARQATASKPRTPPPPPRQREEASLPPLRRLQEARQKEPVRLQGDKQQNWRSLWQAAEADDSPPAALNSRSEEMELRRIPLARARADGLEPSHGEVLRLDDHLLLAWIDGSQLWLLRAPA